jgi:membrane-bound lytic murein transglycosylase D
MVKTTMAPTNPTNRPELLLFVALFSALLTSGSVQPVAADPFWLDQPLAARAAVPPQTLDQLDVQLEQTVEEWGSVRIGEPLVENDPWAEAFAESLRLRNIASPTLNVPRYPVASNAQVQFFLNRFTRERREVVELWLNRSGRFLDMIRETLKRHGLPEELAFTAMIESGFNPAAVSHAGAKGLWQFMAATARRYGLRVDQWVDERLDPEKSTAAAAAYLSDLYKLFGSWSLAQAAYNAGEMTIVRAIRATGSTDFWALARTGFLRRETKEFVPQIHAATIIGREPNRYGFDPSEGRTPAFERVTVPESTDLRRLSTAAGMTADTLPALNAVLVRGVTPPGGSYELRVPPGTSDNVLSALEGARSRAASPRIVRAAAPKRDFHVVRPRETVGSIAKRYGLAVNDVLRWNSLSNRDRLRPGDRLRVADLRSAR